MMNEYSSTSLLMQVQGLSEEEDQVHLGPFQLTAFVGKMQPLQKAGH